MSYTSIRSALETRLNALSPAFPSAWENVIFTPSATAFQRVFLLPAKTVNPSFGDGLKMESGILQVTLCYPENTGPKDAIARAELLRAWFNRGLSMTSGGVTVIVGNTPSIAPAQYEPGLYCMYCIPVSIPFFAYV